MYIWSEFWWSMVEYRVMQYFTKMDKVSHLSKFGKILNYANRSFIAKGSLTWLSRLIVKPLLSFLYEVTCWSCLIWLTFNYNIRSMSGDNTFRQWRPDDHIMYLSAVIWAVSNKSCTRQLMETVKPHCWWKLESRKQKLFFNYLWFNFCRHTAAGLYINIFSHFHWTFLAFLKCGRLYWGLSYTMSLIFY